VADGNAAKKQDAATPTAEKQVVVEAPPKPILLIIVVLLNILAMCSVVAILYISYKAEKEKPKIDDVVKGEVEDAHNKAEEAQKDDDYIGKLVPMETFLVNLAGTRGNKLVKLNMEFEVDNTKVELELDKRKPQIRDIIIILLASKTYDQMTSKQGKEMLRDEVKDTINSFLVKGKIKKVYFSDLIVN